MGINSSLQVQIFQLLRVDPDHFLKTSTFKVRWRRCYQGNYISMALKSLEFTRLRVDSDHSNIDYILMAMKSFVTKYFQFPKSKFQMASIFSPAGGTVGRGSLKNK